MLETAAWRESAQIGSRRRGSRRGAEERRRQDERACDDDASIPVEVELSMEMMVGPWRRSREKRKFGKGGDDKLEHRVKASVVP